MSCGVCTHSWFQASDKVYTLQQGFELRDYPEERIARVKTNLEQGKQAIDKPAKGQSTIFVGNLPFSYQSQVGNTLACALRSSTDK